LNEARDQVQPPPEGRRFGDGRERLRPSILPTLVIVALGVGMSFQLSQTIQRQEDAALEGNAAAIARHLARVIKAQIDDRELGALLRWAAPSKLGAADGSASWQARAERFLADHPSFSGIARIDHAGRVSEAAGTSRARRALTEIAPQAVEQISADAAHEGQLERLVGPIRLPPDGRAALGVPIALAGDVKEPRAIVALLEPAVALRGPFEDSVSGYSIRVLCGSGELFRAPQGDSQPPTDRYWKTEDAALSVPPAWTVAVHPTALLVDGRRYNGATVALVGGLTISALLGALMHVGQIARSRAASVERVGAELRDSIEEVAREETEVRALRGSLETRVSERTATLQDAIDELETFNYSVSHDLRSPMGAVINFSAILTNDYGHVLDEQAKDYLRRISESAAIAVSLMDGLLAFSHSGREAMRKTDVDMRNLVESVREDLATASPAWRAAIQIGELPGAHADASMMRRVFTNLLSNALKFAPPGVPPKVDVGGYPLGDDLVYFVRDHGVGFDMKYAGKLFGVFERLHSSEEFEGHGIGLAIVSRLVRRHGGRVWAQGAVGKGATFLFSLPRPRGAEVGADGTSKA
jgi:signal transduction histidine kinase